MAVFEGIQGLAPERAARLTGLVQQCQSVMAHDGDMDATQRLLHELGIGVLDSILVTRQLLGAGPGDLGQAKTIVLNSPWRESA